jgi:transglutaminase-like putative cysteine protease
MKRPQCYLILLFASIYHIALSQTARINTGPQGNWIQHVDFDSKAKPEENQESSYYYLLLDEQENFTLQEDFTHYAYKILSNEGVQDMSDLSFDFDPSYEKLILHRAVIHRDGKVIDQASGNIQIIQREQSMDRFLYDGSMTGIIHFKDVRIGDIIEYAITRKGYNPIYDKNINRKIYFNYGFAYEKSFKKIIVEDSSKFTFKYFNTDHKASIHAEGNGTSYTWSDNKIPAVVTDSHLPDWYNPYAYVLLSTFKDWGEIATWASHHYTVSETEKQKLAQEISSRFDGKDSEAYVLQAIRFVQDEIRYLGFESGLNSHKPHAPLQVYQQRFGDCKDKSLLLSTLLQIKGIESYPILINTTYVDKLSEQLPSVNAFDHCVVQIKLKDKTIYVDPTINDQGGKLENTYFPYYKKGLIISGTTKDLIDLPRPISSSTREIQTFKMDSIGGGSVLEIETIYSGNEADYQRSYFSKNSLESIQKAYLDYYGNQYPDIKTSEIIKTLDKRDSNQFVVTEYYKISTFWKKSETNADVLLCDFWEQSIQNYFEVSKSTNRTAPYRLAFPVDYTFEIHVHLPTEWSSETAHSLIENDRYDYNYDVTYDDKKLHIITKYKTKDTEIPINEFEKFTSDHSKMMANLNYRLSYDTTTIKAKSNPWLGIIVGVIAFLGGLLLMFWLYNKYDPQPYYPAAWGQPIGGWLILIGIGVSITPIRLAYEFIETPSVISGEAWLILWYTKNYIYFFFVLIEQIYNIVFFLFSLLIVVLFFQRRSSLPALISILYGVSLCMVVLDNVLTIQIDPQTDLDMKTILRSLLAAAIWIPYFRTSQRVKKTFVNNNIDDSGGDGLVPEAVLVNS